MSHLSRTNFGMVEGQGSNCLSEMIAIVEKNMFARSKNLSNELQGAKMQG